MTTAITLRRGDLATTAKRWAALDPPERRRRAVEACRDRDLEALYSLLESHLYLFSGAGAHVSIKTLETYKVSIRVFLRETRHINLLHASRDDAALWVRALEASGKAASTVSVRLAAVRALYRALRWAGALDGDPFADIRPARDRTAAWDRRQPYSDAEITRLLAVATPTERVLVLLGAHVGARAFEMVALRRDDVEPDGRILIRAGKGGKRAYVDCSRSLLVAIEALPVDGPWLLPYRTTRQARDEMHRLCDHAGVPRRGLHALRHYCGSKLQGQLGDISRTARHLRHSSVDTSAIYIHWAEDALKASVGDW